MFCLFNLKLTLDSLGSNYPILCCPRPFPVTSFLLGWVKENNDRICKSAPWFLTVWLQLRIQNVTVKKWRFRIIWVFYLYRLSQLRLLLWSFISQELTVLEFTHYLKKIKWASVNIGPVANLYFCSVIFSSSQHFSWGVMEVTHCCYS